MLEPIESGITINTAERRTPIERRRYFFTALRQCDRNSSELATTTMRTESLEVRLHSLHHVPDFRFQPTEKRSRSATWVTILEHVRWAARCASACLGLPLESGTAHPLTIHIRICLPTTPHAALSSRDGSSERLRRKKRASQLTQRNGRIPIAWRRYFSTAPCRCDRYTSELPQCGQSRLESGFIYALRLPGGQGKGPVGDVTNYL